MIRPEVWNPPRGVEGNIDLVDIDIAIAAAAKEAATG
jgi:hypothetical protein